MSYSRETLTAFSESLRALYAAESPASALHAALPGLSLMLRSRHMFVDELPHDGRPPTPLGGLHLHEVSDAVLRYPSFVHEHPGVQFVRAGGHAPIARILDFISARQLEQTGFYCEIFQPAEIRDQLCLAVRLPRTTIGITFHRDTAFTEDESYLVSLLQPHVATAIQSARGLAAAESQHPHTTVWRCPISSEGDLVAPDPVFAERLMQYFPTHRRAASGLPDEFVRWLKHGQQIVVRLGPDDAALAPWELDHPSGRLRLQLVPSEDRARAILRATETRGPADFFRLRALALTPRECEVVFWIAQGKRDAEIATIFGCATKTVGKHVENLLAKLGAETRLAAVYTAQHWLQHHA